MNIETLPLQAFDYLAPDRATAESSAKLRHRHPAFFKGLESMIGASIEEDMREAALKESRKFENDPLYFDNNPVAQRAVIPTGTAQPRQDTRPLPLRLGRLIILSPGYRRRA